MKTTINLTIHAPSKKAAQAMLDHLLWAWHALHKSGDAPVGGFLERGEIKQAKKEKKHGKASRTG